jgi:16S rRNA processing protein RimM
VPADKQEDEFYFYELEGLEVISATGNVLGTVKNVVQGTGEEILEIIVPGEDTRLIPFAKIAIQGIDLKARCIILQPDFEF